MSGLGERPIAAITTAPGLSGVAIVRLSGPGCLEVARRVFHKKARGPYQSHRMYYGRAQDGERPIDEAMSRRACSRNNAPVGISPANR